MSKKAYDNVIRAGMVDQYLASLSMMEEFIDVCPENLWTDSSYVNQFWHICYHALFYIHLYLYNGLKEFEPWEKHERGAEKLDKNISVMSKKHIAEFLIFCRKLSIERINNIDLLADSSFPWFKFETITRLAYSLRHFQHHIGQISDRLRNNASVDVVWKTVI